MDEWSIGKTAKHVLSFYAFNIANQNVDNLVTYALTEIFCQCLGLYPRSVEHMFTNSQILFFPNLSTAALPQRPDFLEDRFWSLLPLRQLDIILSYQGAHCTKHE